MKRSKFRKLIVLISTFIIIGSISVGISWKRNIQYQKQLNQIVNYFLIEDFQQVEHEIELLKTKFFNKQETEQLIWLTDLFHPKGQAHIQSSRYKQFLILNKNNKYWTLIFNVYLNSLDKSKSEIDNDIYAIYYNDLIELSKILHPERYFSFTDKNSNNSQTSELPNRKLDYFEISGSEDRILIDFDFFKMVHYFEPTEIEKQILSKTDSIYTNFLELVRNNENTGGKKLLLRLCDRVILNEPFRPVVNDIIDSSSTGIFVNAEINSKYIPEDLHAKNPSALGYCLSVNESYHEIDERWYGNLVGKYLVRRRRLLNIEIIDVMSRKRIGKKTFNGPSPHLSRKNIILN